MDNSTSPTSVSIYTTHNVISGQVQTNGRRLADILNDNTTAVLNLEQAAVSLPGEDIQRESQLMMLKESILFVELHGAHEAPKRRFYNYVARDQHRATMLFPGFVVTGTIHLPNRATPWMVLGDDVATPDFIGATDLTIISTRPDNSSFPSEVMVFARRRLEGFAFSSEPATKGTPDQLLTEAKALEDREAIDILQHVRKLNEPGSTDSGTHSVPESQPIPFPTPEAD